MTVEAEAEINFQDFLDELKSRPIKMEHFIDLLKKDESILDLLKSKKTIQDDEFNFVLKKIHNNGWKLSDEEQDIIRKISDRF